MALPMEHLALLNRAQKVIYEELITPKYSLLKLKLEEALGLGADKIREVELIHKVRYSEYRGLEKRIQEIRDKGMPWYEQTEAEQKVLADLQALKKKSFRPTFPNEDSSKNSKIEQCYSSIINTRDTSWRPPSVDIAYTQKKCHLLEIGELFKPEFDQAISYWSTKIEKESSYLNTDQVTDVLRKLKISKSHGTIDKWLEKQDIKHSKRGKYRSIKKEDLLDFISSRGKVYEDIIVLIREQELKKYDCADIINQIFDLKAQHIIETDKDKKSSIKSQIYQKNKDLVEKEKELKPIIDSSTLTLLKSLIGAELFD